MIVYSFHPVTGAYAGETEAQESPLEPGVFLIPAHATTQEPPEPRDGFVCVFANGDWGYVPATAPDADPTPTPEEPQKTKIVKADIWRRATDSEAATIDAMLSAQPVRLRRLWSDAAFLSTTDELFGMIEAAAVQAFGATRAAQLLEPTE